MTEMRRKLHINSEQKQSKNISRGKQATIRAIPKPATATAAAATTTKTTSKQSTQTNKKEREKGKNAKKASMWVHTHND